MMKNMDGYFEWPMAGAYDDPTWPYTWNNQAKGSKNPLARTIKAAPSKPNVAKGA